MIQTNHPEHEILQTLIHNGYQTFAENLLKERETYILPPFSYFAIFRAESKLEKNATTFLSNIKQLLQHNKTIHVSGPVPALLAKRKGLHCQHLLIKSQNRLLLQHALKHTIAQLEKLAAKYRVKWIIDVDPIEV